MKQIILAACCMAAVRAQAQELFVFTEPASNIPAKSISVRASAFAVLPSFYPAYSYVFSPEIRVGISNKLMAAAEGFFGNGYGNYANTGADAYLKFRFFNRDDIHAHFRMAAFARTGIGSSHPSGYAIEPGVSGSAGEAGFIATQLAGKKAVSASLFFLHAFAGGPAANAAGYSLSAGRLVLPKTYKSYDQVNLNVMSEILGQTNFETGRTSVDLAPSLQLIFKSRARLDFGYRFALVRSLEQVNRRSFLLRAEYNFFNAFK